VTVTSSSCSAARAHSATFAANLTVVAGGGTVVDPQVVTRLLQRRKHGQVLERLTGREREVLALMAQGDSNAAISTRLVITEKAVQKHINRILAKLDLPEDGTSARRVQAVLAYLRH
jgi:DNA-binding NarL/FixJ family response regulator